MAPTARGWAFVIATVALAVAAYAVGSPTVLAAACLLAAVVAVAIAIVVSRRLRLRAERVLRERVLTVGARSRISVLVTNRGELRTAVAQWHDVLPWEPFRTPPGHLPSLGRAGATDGSARVHYDVRPTARGVTSIGPLAIEFSDPLGLVRSRSTAAGVQEVIVAPRVYPLEAGVFRAASGDGAVVAVQRSTSGNDVDLMTREYRRGDALRRVHWRASARHGELMVRQEEQRSSPVARILVDTLANGYPDLVVEGPARRPTAVSSASFEWVVSMAASAGVHLQHGGFALQVAVSGDPQLTHHHVGHARFDGPDDLLESLARVRLARDPGFDGSGLGSPEGRDGPVVAIVARPDAETVAWLLGQRQPFERAVAIVVGPSDSEVVDVLTNSGWHVQPVSPTRDDPASAWASLVARSDGSRAHD